MKTAKWAFSVVPCLGNRVAAEIEEHPQYGLARATLARVLAAKGKADWFVPPIKAEHFDWVKPPAGPRAGEAE